MTGSSNFNGPLFHRPWDQTAAIYCKNIEMKFPYTDYLQRVVTYGMIKASVNCLCFRNMGSDCFEKNNQNFFVSKKEKGG